MGQGTIKRTRLLKNNISRYLHVHSANPSRLHRSKSTSGEQSEDQICRTPACTSTSAERWREKPSICARAARRSWSSWKRDPRSKCLDFLLHATPESRHVHRRCVWQQSLRCHGDSATIRSSCTGKSVYCTTKLNDGSLRVILAEDTFDIVMENLLDYKEVIRQWSAENTEAVGKKQGQRCKTGRPTRETEKCSKYPAIINT